MNIPAHIVNIPKSTFNGCIGLTTVMISSNNPPTGITLGEKAFFSCSGLTSINLPEGLISIGKSAFGGCSKLATLTIPSTVTTINNFAFSNCGLLTTATFEGNAPTTILMGTNVFQAAAASFRIYYQPTATGFTSPIWNGYTAIMIGSESPLSTWLFSYGLSATSNLSSDSNGDGVNLLMAYALGLNPNHNLSGSMPKPVFEANQMKLSFHTGTAGVAYVVETSTDLQHWSTEGVSISDAGGIRTATVPRDGTNRFMRLSVSN